MNTRTEEINSLTPTTTCFSSLMNYPVGLENGYYSTTTQIICTRQEKCRGCLVVKNSRKHLGTNEGNGAEQSVETVTSTRTSWLDWRLTSECDRSVSDSTVQQPQIYTSPLHNTSYPCSSCSFSCNRLKLCKTCPVQGLGYRFKARETLAG